MATEEKSLWQKMADNVRPRPAESNEDTGQYRNHPNYDKAIKAYSADFYAPGGRKGSFKDYLDRKY